MLFFYLRLATERRFRTICYICIAITTSSTAAVLFVNLFGCTPISGNWDRRPSNPSVCITRPSFYYYSGISNILIDLLLMVLPIPILLKMKLKWRVKLGLVMMFSMGFLFVNHFLRHYYHHHHHPLFHSSASGERAANLIVVSPRPQSYRCG